MFSCACQYNIDAQTQFFSLFSEYLMNQPKACHSFHLKDSHVLSSWCQIKKKRNGKTHTAQYAGTKLNTNIVNNFFFHRLMHAEGYCLTIDTQWINMRHEGQNISGSVVMMMINATNDKDFFFTHRWLRKVWNSLRAHRLESILRHTRYIRILHSLIQSLWIV